MPGIKNPIPVRIDVAQRLLNKQYSPPLKRSNVSGNEIRKKPIACAKPMEVCMGDRIQTFSEVSKGMQCACPGPSRAHPIIGFVPEDLYGFHVTVLDREGDGDAPKVLLELVLPGRTQ